MVDRSWICHVKGGSAWLVSRGARRTANDNDHGCKLFGFFTSGIRLGCRKLLNAFGLWFDELLFCPSDV